MLKVSKSIKPSIHAYVRELECYTGNCHCVAFEIELIPGRFEISGNQAIDWKVIDNVWGDDKVVGCGTAYISGAGGKCLVICEFPMPVDCIIPIFENLITIIIDPDEKIDVMERRHLIVTTIGTCYFPT